MIAIQRKLRPHALTSEDISQLITSRMEELNDLRGKVIEFHSFELSPQDKSERCYGIVGPVDESDKTVTLYCVYGPRSAQFSNKGLVKGFSPKLNTGILRLSRFRPTSYSPDDHYSLYVSA